MKNIYKSIGSSALRSWLLRAKKITAVCCCSFFMLAMMSADLSAQTAVCQNITVNVDASGVTTIMAADLDGGSSAFSALYINSVGNPSVDVSCADHPTVSLMLIASNGTNTDDCVATVTLVDTDFPSAVCQNITANVGDVLVPGDLDNGSTDDCSGIVNMEIDGGASYTVVCDDAAFGTISLDLEVFDAEGNNDLTSCTVTVSDNVTPVASCSDFTLNLSTGTTIAASDVGSFTDNCTDNISESLDINSFSCADIGSPVTVTYTVNDGFNSDDCTAVVTVVDDEDPTIDCLTGTLNVDLDAAGNASITEGQIIDVANDNCGVASTSISPMTFDCTNLGSNTVTATVTDDAGLTNTCTRTVVISDVDAPVAACSPTDITVQLDASGNASITAADVNDGSSDNCTAGLSINQSVFSCANVGSNTITLTVDDGVNPTDDCTATVVVEDMVAPMAICQDVTVTLAGPGNTASLTPPEVDNGSNDACGIASLSINVSSFDCNSSSPTTVTLTIVDVNGQSATCTSSVTVQEQTGALDAVCQNITLDLNDGMSITPADVDGGSIGDCGLTLNNVVPNTFDCTNLGTNSVTLVVTDNSGNTDVCNANVDVMNNVTPVAECISDLTVQLDATGNATITSADIDDGSYAEWAGAPGVPAPVYCGTLSYALSDMDFDCTDVGKAAISVTMTVTESLSTNTDDCTTNIVVEDMNDPVAACQDVTIELEFGQACTTAMAVDNGSTDECNTLILSLDRTNFDCSDLGTYTTTLTATDASGNTDQCTATITIEDNSAPTAICQDITVNLDATTGIYNLMASELDNGSHDQQTPGATGVYNVSDNLSGSCSVAFLDISGTGTQLSIEDILQGNGLDAAAGISTVNSYTFYGNTYTQMSIDHNGSVYLGVFGNFYDFSNEAIDGTGASNLPANTPSIHPLWDDWDSDIGNVYWQEISGVLYVQWNDLPHFSGGDCSNAGDGVTFQLQWDSGTDNISFVYNDLDEECPSGSTLYDDAVGASIGIDNADGVNFYQFSVNTAQPGLTCISFDPSSSGTPIDNCSAPTDLSFAIEAGDMTSFSCVDIAAKGGAGTFTVTLEVEDESGNMSNCDAQVTVLDASAPVITCMSSAVDIVLGDDGFASVADGDFSEVDLLASFTDNCLISGFNISPNSFNCGDIGSPITVTVDAFDETGSFSTPCTVDVNILDQTGPTLTCQDLTTANGNPVQIGTNLSVYALQTAFSDACGFDNALLSLDPFTMPVRQIEEFDCSSMGSYSLTVYASDIYGNVSSCTSNIDVVDTSPVSVSCFSNSVILDSNGDAMLSPSQMASWNDSGACGTNLAVSVSQFMFDCSDEFYANGNTPVTVTVTVTDDGGNSASCDANIFVYDFNGTQNLTISNCPATSPANPLEYSIDPTTLEVQFDATQVAADLGVTINSVCDNFDWGFANPTYYSAVNDQCSFGPSGVNYLNNYSFGQPLSGAYDCSVEGQVLQATIIPYNNFYGWDPKFTSDSNAPGCGYYYANVCRVYLKIATEAPVAACFPDYTVNLDNNGTYSLIGSTIDDGSTDDCGTPFSTVAPSEFECSDIGSATTVTLTVFDNSGNSSTCTSNITVEDNMAPLAACTDVTVNLDGDGLGSVMPEDFDDNSSDNCTTITFSTDLATTSFTCADHGSVIPVAFMVTDGSGNVSTDNCNLTIQDITAPTAVCATDVSVQLDEITGDYQLSMTELEGGSTDNCGVVSATHLPVAFTCHDLGTQSVTLTVIDNSGLITTTSCDVEVLGTAPIAVCQDVTVDMDMSGMGSITEDAVNNGSSDLCDAASGGLTFDTDVIDFTCTDGTTSVTLTVTDADGMSDQCSANVTVRDLIAPTAVCATGVSVQLDATSGEYTLSATEVNGTSSDNCSYTASIPSTVFDCTLLGGNPSAVVSVDLTVTDPSGNSNTAPCNVTVTNPAPVASCLVSYDVTLDALTGTATIAPSDIDDSSSDICGDGLNYSISQGSVSCADGASVDVTLTVSDASGNSDDCMTTINISDPAPLAVCTDITVDLDASGNYDLAGNESMLDGGSSDACGETSFTYSTDISMFDCTNLAGPVAVTLTVMDANGNSDDCTANVTVEDNLGPDMECQDITVYLDASGGFAGLTAAMIDNGSADACDGASITIDIASGSPTTFDCTNEGMSYTIQLNGTDSNGNLGICNAQVTVEKDPAYPCSCVNDYEVINDVPVPDGLYPANINITSQGLIQVGGNVHYKAGESIDLLQGFEVQLGAQFLGEIGPCP